jgi:hypothetical protein
MDTALARGQTFKDSTLAILALLDKWAPPRELRSSA